MNILPYASVARPDHWFKNIFMLPRRGAGAVFSAGAAHARRLAAGGVGPGGGLPDRFRQLRLQRNPGRADGFAPPGKMPPAHPERPGRVPVCWGMWVALSAAGLALAWRVNPGFGGATWRCGSWGFLQPRPIRLKDLPYADVLSESLNNPIRLALGWFSTGLARAAAAVTGAGLLDVRRVPDGRQAVCGIPQPGRSGTRGALPAFLRLLHGGKTAGEHILLRHPFRAERRVFHRALPF